MTPFNLDAFIEATFAEDIGAGDHTSLACISSDSYSKARLLVKEDGVLAGMDVAERIFQWRDRSLQMDRILEDGAKVKAGMCAFEVSGKTQSILVSERIVLNIMQRMSGVATVTRQYCDAVAHTRAKVLDTRKTTPGMRWLEKKAVTIGGGHNHRHGLFDMILIKDNHVDACGGVTEAIDRAKEYLERTGLLLDIEIEVRNLEQLERVLTQGCVDRIMLDNFSVQDTLEAVNRCRGRVPLESSGGINLSTIVAYAECGVDYISVGALTHSVRALDLSLKISQ